MEFHEKLQELRKSRNLTQEELAEALYVSRTAISKWESGRGYPSIDSLKAISKFFSVSIDELLSAETLVTIAESDNRTQVQSMCNLLLGVVDLMSILLLLLPLYSREMDGVIASVNLWNFKPVSAWVGIICWILIIALIMLGIAKILLNYLHMENWQRMITTISIGIGMLAVIYFAMIREVYCIVIVFLQLMMKMGLLLEQLLKNVSHQ